MNIPPFKNKKLLETALTHRSTINELSLTAAQSNERLEYLGDAVLELIVSEYLFQRFPNEPEGKLTAYRSALVKTESLAELAQAVGLDQALKLSKGEEKSGGRSNPSLLADVTEAVIGALYLDQGYEAVKRFLQQHLFGKLDVIVRNRTYLDPKSYLQEKVQSEKKPTPTYQVIKETGPDHNKHFVVTVTVADKVLATGEGKSKQQAQRDAARNAIEKYYN